MADYWVILENNQTAVVEGVIMSPTLVPEDIMDAYYRDGGVNIAFASDPSAADAPVSVDAATGTAITYTFAPNTAFLTDENMHIAPRQLAYKLSYWEFQTASLNYYFRFDRVVGMSTSQPPSF